MRARLYLKRLTNLTPLLLALALACGAATVAHAAAQEQKQTAPPAALLAALKGKDKEARDAADEKLRQMGQAAVPALTKLLQKKGPGRVYAAATLASIDPANALARQTLEDFARNGKGDEVIAAAMSLYHIDPENDAAVPALAAMASKPFLIPSQENWDGLVNAAFALAQSAPGIRALTPLLGHWDTYVRRAAVFAMDDLTETLGYASPSELAAVREAIPALVKALADEDEIVRRMAAEELQQIGPDTIPELKKAAAGDNRKLATAAVELLEEMSEEVDEEMGEN